MLNNRGAAEDALMVIGQVADKLGSSFEGYMPTLQPILGQAIMNFQDYQVCRDLLVPRSRNFLNLLHWGGPRAQCLLGNIL